MRTKKEYLKVIQLKKSGLNNSQISKLLEIPRTTINSWIKSKPNFEKNNNDDFNPEKYIVENKLENTYSYILGLYLGDGYINKMKRTYRLRIFNTKEYEQLNNHIKRQLQILFPNNKIGFVDFKSYLSIHVYSNKLIPHLFPQNGIGRKHTRNIKLVDWQKRIISHKHLLMGLFHSDGTFYYRKNKKNIYPAYGFRNESDDIHEIFQNCCRNLNISYTFSIKRKNTNIYKNNDVIKLKEIIGTKTKIPN